MKTSVTWWLALASATACLAAGGGSMKISSTAFAPGANIPAQYTCDGANTSPALQIQGVPAEAKSLVLIMDDPDAPTGLFTHWMVWNMDPKMGAIGEGGTPAGTNGRNDFGENHYGGPCPPSGTHRYFFRILALDRKLDLAAGASRKQLDAAMKGHVVAQGELMGRYARHK